MLTIEAARTALEQSHLEDRYSGGGLTLLVRLANRELRSNGHGEHEIIVERIAPFFGDPEVLDWSLWCETCHVTHRALFAAPTGQPRAGSQVADGGVDIDLPQRRRWSLWPWSPGLMQRLLGWASN